ncbi:MAG TPA: DUF6088 family protein [Thermodesulfobacteriota bacterium]|nr:DUF6088 family protein [Thermodesulfobacteriota bacterium]
MNTITDTITRRIRAKGRGWVFTPKDFLDIGTRAAVDQTLSRLSSKGVIRRLDNGIYDFPRIHDKLGTLAPNVDDLAKAIATKTGKQIFPSGAAAANYLGLSTQVPSRPVYLTNGPSKQKKIAGRTITLKHAAVPIMNNVSDKANFVLQALHYLGQNNIDDNLIQHCVDSIDKKDMKDLMDSISKIPGWMSAVVLKMQMKK